MIGASALLGGSGPVFWDSSAAEKRAVNSVVQTVFSQKELLITQAQVQLQTTLNARIELLTAQLTSEQQEEALMLNLLGLLSKHPNVPVPGTTFSPTKNTTTSPIDP
ncbi:hypothetical protein Pelo_4810 [Pelomyxa schiedti]|nr:hypothetical protein Pelo_4810 [Pelomyxa schiedti]